MHDIGEWNKKIYKNADGSFVDGDKITANELWDLFGIKSSPKFRGACYSHIPIRWTEDVKNMLYRVSNELKGKIEITQIKEKWCYLTVYYKSLDSGKAVKNCIQEIIRECKKNLVSKGVHPPFNV